MKQTHPAFAMLALGLVACDGVDYDTPEAEDYDEIAEAVASTTASSASSGNEVAAMSQAYRLITGDVPDDLAVGVDGNFNGVITDFSFSYRVSCLDVSGGTTDCGEAADGAQVSIDWEGNIDTRRYDLILDRDGQWSITDVLSGEPTFNGQSDFSVESSFQSLSGAYNNRYVLIYEANYTNIRLDPITLLPIDGAISYMLDAEREVDGSSREVDARFLVEVDVEFSEDSFATITLDGERRYTLNIETGDVSPE